MNSDEMKQLKADLPVDIAEDTTIYPLPDRQEPKAQRKQALTLTNK